MNILPLKVDQDRLKKYIDEYGSECPRCHSNQIEGNKEITEEGMHFIAMRCLDCDLSWDEVYYLSGVNVDKHKNDPTIICSNYHNNK